MKPTHTGAKTGQATDSARLAAARDVLNNAVTEKALQQQIIDLAEITGWWTFHVRDSRGSNPGWPDLVLLRPPNLILWEVKTERGRVRPEQQAVIDALMQVEHVSTGIVRPSDWPSVEAVLRVPRR